MNTKVNQNNLLPAAMVKRSSGYEMSYPRNIQAQDQQDDVDDDMGWFTAKDHS